ncbi:hypothetical protein [Azospirillum sp. ST 5-10]|uniref:hypothetical protein n=1 Tax=unclassified Azospirillum TaxID=2630922 RepID=UPI003F4A19FF
MTQRTRALTLACLLFALPVVAACDNEGPAEQAGEEIGRSIDNAGENVGDATDNAADGLGDAMQDAGEAIEDAANDARR